MTTSTYALEDGKTCPWPSAEITQCPYPFYEVLRDDAPVFKMPSGDYLVSRWEDIVYITQHPELFSNRALESDEMMAKSAWVRSEDSDASVRSTPYSMSATDPPEHKAKRTLGLRMFTHEKMRQYDPLVRRLCNELIDKWIDRGTCDFTAEFANLLPIEVVCEILGLPREDAERLQYLGDIEAGGALRYVSEERAHSDHAKSAEMAEYVKAALLDRIDRPTDDFLSELIQAQQELDGKLDLDYLINESALLLFAGNVTTAHLLASMMVALCEEPGRIESLRGSGPRIKQYVEEVLRLESPVQWLQRICLEDTEVDGVPIPAGAWVNIFYAAGNRDERKFEHPAALDLERRNVAKHSLVFGRGIHLCLGAPLARLEGLVAFEVLLERLSSIRVLEAESDLRNLESVRFRAPRRISIAFEAVA